eukprot:scaffold21556_cov120-Isochrysis_galbana.AAC.8
MSSMCTCGPDTEKGCLCGQWAERRTDVGEGEGRGWRGPVRARRGRANIGGSDASDWREVFPQRCEHPSEFDGTTVDPHTRLGRRGVRAQQ